MSQATFVSGNPIMINYTPGSDVTAGDVIVYGNLIGIAHSDIAANELGALAIGGGVYKITGDAAIAVGKRIYWNNTDDKGTETASTHKILGYSVSACSGDGSTFNVLHNTHTDIDTDT